MKPLDGMTVVTLAANLPGPVAARGLQRLGAKVVKIEPPAGDPLRRYCEPWYRDLCAGQQVLTLDLKAAADMRQLEELLHEADLLITATRPAALAKLGLGHEAVHYRFPRLCQIVIVGYPAPRDNEAGHDLTYQAEMGLLTPPALPRTLLADMAGGERALATALALLLGRDRSGEGGYAEIALSEAVHAMAEPMRYGVTAEGTLLGGGLPGYNLYRSRDGWVALAALEPHFMRRLEAEVGCEAPDRETLQDFFASRSASEWQAWGAKHDIPVVAVAAG